MVISGQVELLFNSELRLPNADTTLRENIRWCCNKLSRIASNVFLSRKEMNTNRCHQLNVRPDQ